MHIFNNIKQQELITNFLGNKLSLFSRENTSRFSSYKIHLAKLMSIRLARLICYLIPAHYPFQANLNLWGKFIRILPVCKLSTVYPNFLNFRRQAENFLQDVGMQNI
jgi:hypothetical protein